MALKRTLMEEAINERNNAGYDLSFMLTASHSIIRFSK